MPDTQKPIPEPSPPPAPKKKRRGWWWKIPLVLFTLLIILVLLIPTIVSTGTVRRMVTSRVSDQLNGTVEIADWSVSWTGGVFARGVRVLDRQGNSVVEIASLSTQLSLLSAAGGNFATGKTDIKDPVVNIVIDENGRSNLEDLLPKSNASPTGSTESRDTSAGKDGGGKLPSADFDLNISNITGTITKAGLPPVRISSGSVLLKAASLNDPIEQSIDIEARVGEGAPGRLQLVGKTSAIRNGQVDVDQLDSVQKLTISNLDLAAANAVLAALGKNSAAAPPVLGGIASGAIDVTIDGINNIVIDGALSVDRPTASGGPLAGDTLALASLNIPIQITRSAAADGSTILKITSLGVNAPGISLAASGEVPEDALLRALANQAPGKDGSILVTLKVDNVSVLNQLRQTLNLGQGVDIRGGRIWSETNLWLKPDSAVAKVRLDVRDVAGTKDGQPIAVSPVVVSIDATTLPGGASVPILRDLALLVESGFAQIKGGGASLAALNIVGRIDLSKLVREAGQFVDFGQIKLSGNAGFTVTASAPGDVSQLKPGDAVAAAATLTLTDLVVAGLADIAPLSQPWLELKSSAQVIRGDDASPVRAVRDIKVTLMSGERNAPTVDVLATVEAFDPQNQIVRFNLQRAGVSNLAELQKQFGPLLVPLHENGLTFERGSVSLSAAGTYDGPTQSLSANVNVAGDGITLAQQTGETRTNVVRDLPLSVNLVTEAALGGAVQRIRIEKLDVSAGELLVMKLKDPSIPLELATDGTATGVVQMWADVKALADVAGAFAEQTPGEPAPADLQSARMDGVIEFGRDENTTRARAVINLANIAVKNSAIRDESMGLEIDARLPAAMDTATLTAQLTSKFANVKADPVQLRLKTGEQPAGTWEMLQNAGVSIDVPDLESVWVLARSFSRPAAIGTSGGPPVPALNVRGGSLAAVLRVTRDGNATKIDVSRLNLVGLALSRGDRTYQSKSQIDLKLAATLDATDDPAGKKSLMETVRAVRVTQLGGPVEVATLEMPEPIVLENLATTPSARGTIALVGGDIDELSKILEVLGDSDMPYRGKFDLRQSLATAGNAITLRGDVNVRQLEVIDESGAPAFAEDRVAIRNDLSVDPKTETAIINLLDIDMPTSGAAKVSTRGKISQWSTQRVIDNLKLTLDYDLQKLWPLVKPMLAGETQESLKDLKILGKSQRTFTVTGRYPADLPSNEAIALLSAEGSLAIESLKLPASGIDVGAAELPFLLRKAVVYLTDASGTPAKPISFNNGMIDLREITIDLSKPDPRLNTPSNHPLITGASLNPLFADKVLGKVINNPLFVDPKQARGLLDVLIVRCERLPLGELMNKESTDNDGVLEAKFSVTEVQIGNKMLEYIFQFAGSEDKVLIGNIKDATVKIEGGRATSDITLALGQKTTAPLRIAGTVRLRDQKLMPMNLSLPMSLFSKRFGGDLKKYLPDSFDLALTGSASAPVMKLEQAFGKLLADAGQKALIENLTGGKKKEEPRSDAPRNDDDRAEKKLDNGEDAPAVKKEKKPIQDLIDIISGKEKDDEKDKADRDDEKDGRKKDEKKKNKKKKDDEKKSSEDDEPKRR